MLKVLHIDSEKTWRGGENQMRLLMEGGQGRVQCFLACPAESIAAKKLTGTAQIIPTSFSPLRMIPEAARIAKICREEGIQLIDCQSSKAHGFALLVKSFYPHLKLLVHRRVDFAPSKSFFSRRKYMSKKVDAFVPISDAIARILVDYGIPSEKTHHHPQCRGPSAVSGTRAGDGPQNTC